MRRTNRRDFLKHTTLAGAGFWVAGTSVQADDKPAKSANEKLNVALVGVGGRGGANLSGLGGENIVALCDVDDTPLGKAGDKHPKAKKFNDFRKMLDEMHKEIDAVAVSTPDHAHAVASMAALKLGKHVYCEKPLTHDVYEARALREQAAKSKVATQMGNQGTAGGGLRRAVELIQAGAIGPIKEAHIWTNRPIWPQGIDRPADKPEVPQNVHWDLWLGPAPERPYHPAYHPFKWRGWWDFGTGALGDMGCHTANLAFMALKLKYPTSVEAESSKFNTETYQTWARVNYDFPARDDMPPVKVTWYEGRKDGKLVLPPVDLLQKYKMPEQGYTVVIQDGKVAAGNIKQKDDIEKLKHVGSGCFIVGEKGVLFSPSDYGGQSFFIREGGIEEIKGGPEKLAKSPGHHQEFILACKGGPPPMSNFDYAGLLTEFILLGNVAVRTANQRGKLEWDGENLKAKNVPEAELLIRREYRKGWTL